jgi:hypothetical protein
MLLNFKINFREKRYLRFFLRIWIFEIPGMTQELNNCYLTWWCLLDGPFKVLMSLKCSENLLLHKNFSIFRKNSNCLPHIISKLVKLAFFRSEKPKKSLLKISRHRHKLPLVMTIRSARKTHTPRPLARNKNPYCCLCRATIIVSHLNKWTKIHPQLYARITLQNARRRRRRRSSHLGAKVKLLNHFYL